eukprot:COSAG01_NODE_23073_length_829_cov_1.949315_1_plen_58_part_01
MCHKPGWLCKCNASHSELVDDGLLTGDDPVSPHACGLLFPEPHELVDDWLLADSTDSW